MLNKLYIYKIILCVLTLLSVFASWGKYTDFETDILLLWESVWTLMAILAIILEIVYRW